MAVSIFEYKSAVPDSSMVATVLLDIYHVWDELINHVKTQYPNVVEEWKYYGNASGWALKLISNK